MIFSGPIIITIFLAALGLILGLLAAAVWLRQSLGNGPVDLEQGDPAYLVFLLLLTAFGLRVLAWPLSYIALDSAVPHVQGAMCIFGVTRLCPLWANMLQGLRPLLILALGGWLLLRVTHSRRQRQIPGRERRRPLPERMLFLTALVLLITDCILELLVFSLLRPDQTVYCCGSVYDLPNRFSSLIPGSLFGPQHAHLLLPLLIGSGILCAAGCLLGALAAWRGWTAKGEPCRRSMLLLSVLVPLFMLLFIAVACIAAMEVITPRVTGLPYHHCLYCLLGKTTVGPWLAVTMAMAMMGAFWGSLLLPSPSRRIAGLLLCAGGFSVLAFLGITDGALGRMGQGGDLGSCPSCDRPLFDTVYLVEVVSGEDAPALCCSAACALDHIERHGGRGAVNWVTVRDEFTGKRLDSGAAYFVEAGTDIDGLLEGNRWHVYQYLENAHIMAFELGGNVVPDPFGEERSIGP